MTFFFDNNLSPHLAAFLANLGYEVKHLRELYPPPFNVKDIEWIPEIAAKGWITLTQDIAITRNAEEKKALNESGATVLFIERFYGNRTALQQAAWLLSHWKEIMEQAELLAKGSLRKIKENGTLTHRL